MNAQTPGLEYISTNERVRLKLIEIRARSLMVFIGANTGNTADWPVRIHVDDDLAESFNDKLNAMQEALK